MPKKNRKGKECKKKCQKRPFHVFFIMQKMQILKILGYARMQIMQLKIPMGPHSSPPAGKRCWLNKKKSCWLDPTLPLIGWDRGGGPT